MIADLKQALAANDFTAVERRAWRIIADPPNPETAVKALKILRTAGGWTTALTGAQTLYDQRPHWPESANALLAMRVRLGVLDAPDLEAQAAEMGVFGKALAEKRALHGAFTNNHGAAIAEREALLSAHPSDFANLMELLWLHWLQGDPAQAKVLLEDAAARPEATGMAKVRLNQARRWIEDGTRAPAAADLQTLAALTLEHTDDIPLATRMIADARRADVFHGTSAQAKPSQSHPNAVPPLLHQYWEGDILPDGVRILRALNQSRLPDYDHRLWSDADAPALLRAAAGAAGEQAFAAAPYAAFRANLVRLAALLRHGGLYLDIDDRIATDSGGGALSSEAYYVEALGPVANNMMIAPAGSPFIADALEHAVAATLDNRFGDDGWRATGVGCVTRRVAVWAARAVQNGRTAPLALWSESEARSRFAFHLPLDYKRAGGWKARRYG